MLYVSHFQTYLNRGEKIHRKENHVKYLQSSKICSQGHFQLNWLGATTRKLAAARFLPACKDSNALEQGNMLFCSSKQQKAQGMAQALQPTQRA